jgi:hypothetical protein
MMSVQRYRPATCYCGDTREPEGPVPDGGWVRYEDYAGLQAEVERLMGLVKDGARTQSQLIRENARLRTQPTHPPHPEEIKP